MDALCFPQQPPLRSRAWFLSWLLFEETAHGSPHVPPHWLSRLCCTLPSSRSQAVTPLKRKQWKRTSPETVSVPSCAPITCLLHDGTPTGLLVLAVPIPPARQPRPHDHRGGHSWQELDVTQSADSSQCHLLSHNRLSSPWPGLTTTPHGTRHGPFAGDCCASRSPGSVCLEARSSDHASPLGARSLGFSAICTLTPNFHI